MKLCLFTLFAFASALPTVGASLTLTDIIDPNGVMTSALSPFTSLSIPGGTSSDDLLWYSAGAQISTVGPALDLGFSGTFVCEGMNSCSDTFEVDYGATGYLSGTTTYVALSGFTTEGFVSGDALGGLNQTLGYTYTNTSGPFSISSTPILVSNPANFSGEFFVTISLPGGNTTYLSSGSTADLLVTPGSGSGVPEPGTLAIVAACGLLLFYVKRLRKA